MRAYEPYENYTSPYPEDFKIIKDYLTQHGQLNVGDRVLDDLWMDWSDAFYSASYLHPDMELLERFADWLSNKEL